MRQFPETRIDFMSIKGYCIAGSMILILAGLLSIYIKGGLRVGVEFTGGTLIQIQFNTKQEFDELRRRLANAGLKDVILQEYGETGVVIRVRAFESEPEAMLRQAFDGKEYEVLSMEGIGPQVSKSLQRKALVAIIIANLGILGYVGYRFQPGWGLAGVMSLIHDVLVTLGICSFFDKEITLSVIAAFLTLIGYSINDTIVIFDRIRENLKLKKGMSFTDIINLSINQNIARTVLTSFTVFLVVTALFFFGGSVIHDFAFVLLIGIITGTYSTMFIAAPVIIYLRRG